MFYLFMFLWALTGMLFIVGLIYWLVKRKNGRLVLYSFTASFVCLIIGITINANEPPYEAEAIQENQEIEQIIDATQFSRITPEELISILGEPDSKDESDYTGPSGSYDSTFYIYDDGKFEFMVIDNNVVRFTYNGKKSEFNSEEDLFNIFNIDTGPNLIKVNDTPGAIRFQMVNDKIADVWVSFGDDHATYKITYNINYFS
jgi:hypothetical protein